jgi:hypothetical protein
MALPPCSNMSIVLSVTHKVFKCSIHYDKAVVITELTVYDGTQKISGTLLNVEH